METLFFFTISFISIKRMDSQESFSLIDWLLDVSLDWKFREFKIVPPGAKLLGRGMKARSPKGGDSLWGEKSQRENILHVTVV